MDFNQYKEFTKKYLETNDPIRLDCMNPFKSMSHFIDETKVKNKRYSLDDIISMWLTYSKTEIKKENLLISSGVRDFIQGINSYFAEKNYNLYLPNDVYPVYWEITKNFNQVGYDTLYNLDSFNFLKTVKEKSVLLIPEPITPLGRRLNETEVENIKTWLASSKDNVLVIDAVYFYYTSLLDLFYSKFYNNDQVIIMWSLSKAWLLNKSCGFGYASDKFKDIQNHLSVPDYELCSAIGNRLKAYETLPENQLLRFFKEWTYIENLLKDKGLKLERPITGYFTTIDYSFEELLNKDILAIPPSVFGSKYNNFSVVTCLYDIKRKDTTC